MAEPAAAPAKHAKDAGALSRVTAIQRDGQKLVGQAPAGVVQAAQGLGQQIAVLAGEELLQQVGRAR